MANPSSPLIWVLADERIGNVNQCLGVAEALDFPFIRKNIAYTRFASLPNLLRGASLLGVDTSKSDPLTGPWPDVVLAAGRKTAPIARYIKRKSGRKCLTVQLMWPGYPLTGLDIIALPQHDTAHHLPKTSKTVLLPTIGAAHRVTSTRLEAEAAHWLQEVAPFPAPRIAVLIGGATKNDSFTADHMLQMGAQLSQMATQAGGSLLVSTSRRTGSELVSALRQSITAPCYFHEWTPEGANPYFGFLGVSDAIVVTGDSMSMCSEACATGKPVYIFSPAEITSGKHLRLHQQLYALGFAKAFTGQWEAIAPYTPLNVAGEIAAVIRERL